MYLQISLLIKTSVWRSSSKFPAPLIPHGNLYALHFPPTWTWLEEPQQRILCLTTKKSDLRGRLHLERLGWIWHSRRSSLMNLKRYSLVAGELFFLINTLRCSKPTILPALLTTRVPLHLAAALLVDLLQTLLLQMPCSREKRKVYMFRWSRTGLIFAASTYFQTRILTRLSMKPTRSQVFVFGHFLGWRLLQLT